MKPIISVLPRPAYYALMGDCRRQIETFSLLFVQILSWVGLNAVNRRIESKGLLYCDALPLAISSEDVLNI